MNINQFSRLSVHQREETLSLAEESGLNFDGQRIEFVAMTNNQIVGWISSEIGGGYITFGVHEDFHNRGIATGLVQRLIEKGKVLKWDKLIADPIHPATFKICEKLGFKKNSKRRVFELDLSSN